MVNFLLGWCVISVFGTVLALRLIRNGKTVDEHSVENANASQDKAVQDEVNLPTDDHSLHPRGGHSR